MNLARMISLSSTIKMPVIGIGTYQMKDQHVLMDIIDAGLEAGYRMIDTAGAYGNEMAIGQLLTQLLPKYSLKREDIFLTSKLSFAEHGKEKAYRAALKSLESLQLEYLDLYLIHFPGVYGIPFDDERLPKFRKESWQDLERLVDQGKVRAIGVSNYQTWHLDEFDAYAKIKPAVNQCEFHPYLCRYDLVKHCRKKGIHFQASMSLAGINGKEQLLSEPVVRSLAVKHKCTEAQLLLAFALCHGFSVIPKSTNTEHVCSNFKSINVSMAPEDMEALSTLHTGDCFGWNSENVL